MTVTADTTQSTVYPWENVDLGDKKLPDSTVANATATRTIILYLIVESFDLTVDEKMWAGWVLDDVCADILSVAPYQVPVAVRQELLKGTYTKLLKTRGLSTEAKIVYDPDVVQASMDEWVSALMLPITASYDLEPMIEISMRSRLVGLLTDLGVGHPINPRGATYLPTELRQHILAS